MTRTVIEIDAYSAHHKRAISKAWLELAKADEKLQEEREELADTKVEGVEDEKPQSVKKEPEKEAPKPKAEAAPEPVSNISSGAEDRVDPAANETPAPAPAPAPAAFQPAPNQPFTPAQVGNGNGQ